MAHAWQSRRTAGEIYSSQPGRAEKLKDVMLELDGRQRPVQVEEALASRRPSGVQVRGHRFDLDAETWAGADMLVPESGAGRPEEGEYSHADLIGCKVVGREPKLGVVTGVEEYGGPPLLESRSARTAVRF